MSIITDALSITKHIIPRQKSDSYRICLYVRFSSNSNTLQVTYALIYIKQSTHVHYESLERI